MSKIQERVEVKREKAKQNSKYIEGTYNNYSVSDYGYAQFKAVYLKDVSDETLAKIKHS